MVECRHKRIIERDLALLLNKSLPISFWPYSVKTATYLVNMLLTKVILVLSLSEMLYKKDFPYDAIKVFGCQCFPFMIAYNSDKIQPRSVEYVFLGYATSQKVHVCFDKDTCKIIISCHLVFNEGVFPFSTQSSLYFSKFESLALIYIPTYMLLAVYLEPSSLVSSPFFALAPIHNVSISYDSNISQESSVLVSVNDTLSDHSPGNELMVLFEPISIKVFPSSSNNLSLIVLLPIPSNYIDLPSSSIPLPHPVNLNSSYIQAGKHPLVTQVKTVILNQKHFLQLFFLPLYCLILKIVKKT